MSRVRFTHVSVRLGGRTVVDDVSLEIGAGEWVGVIGPNGAGKTTLLRALARLVAYDGDIAIGSQDPRHLSRRDLAQRVAVVPQQPTIPAGMTVLDYALLGRTPYISYLGSEGPADIEVVRDVLRRLDLDGLDGRALDQLSGGEFQRAVLARALAQAAPVLLLDEPTTALDVGHQQQVMELVDELRHEHGLTVLSAMHDLTVAGQFADRLLLMADGRAVACGAVRDVLTERTIADNYAASVRVLDLPDGVVVVPLRTRATVTELPNERETS